MLCLAFGKMLSAVLPAGDKLLLVGQYAGRARDRTIRLATCVGVLAVVAEIVLLRGNVPWLSFVFLSILASIWRWLSWAPQASVQNPWLATALVCLVVTTYGFSTVIPLAAEWRSAPGAAATVQKELEGNVPVVFFGRSMHSAEFAIHQGEIHEFTRRQFEEFAAFMAKHPQAVVVAQPREARLIRSKCEQTIELTDSDVHNKVYVAKDINSHLQHAKLQDKVLK